MITTQFLQKQVMFLKFLKTAKLVSRHLGIVRQRSVAVHSLTFILATGR